MKTVSKLRPKGDETAIVCEYLSSPVWINVAFLITVSRTYMLQIHTLSDTCFGAKTKDTQNYKNHGLIEFLSAKIPLHRNLYSAKQVFWSI